MACLRDSSWRSVVADHTVLADGGHGNGVCHRICWVSGRIGDVGDQARSGGGLGLIEGHGDARSIGFAVLRRADFLSFNPVFFRAMIRYPGVMKVSPNVETDAKKGQHGPVL